MDNEHLQSTSEQILAGLKSDNSSEVRDAAFSAGDMGLQAAIPDLCKHISSSNIGVQEAAEYALRKIRGPEVIENMLPLLQSEEPSVRNVAMDILREIGVDSIESMRPYLKGEDPDLRIFVSDILGHCHSHKSLDLLCEALLKDPEVNVRYQAAVSLGNLAYPESVKALSQAMHDEEWVQFAVVEALAKIKDTSAISAMVQLLHQCSPLVSSAIVDALGDLGDIKIIPLLLNALERVNEALRHKIVKAVVKILDGASLALLPPKFKTNLNAYLRSALTDSDEEIQAAALTGLKSIGTVEASGPVLDYVARLNPETNAELYDLGIQTLASLGYTQAINDALQSNDEHKVQVALQVSQYFDDPALKTTLKELFLTFNPEFKRVAINKIAQLGDCQDMPFFLCVMQECNDPEIIKGVLNFLGSQSTCNDIEDIVFNQLLEQQNQEVQELALEACINLHSANLNERFKIMSREGDVMQRMMAIYALGRYGVFENYAEIVAGLQDPEPAVRRTAIEAFLNLGPDAEHVLPQILSSAQDPDKDVRMAVVNLLGHIAQPSVLPYLMAALHDEDDWVRIRAIEALGYARCEEAIPSLSEILEKDNPMVVSKAIEALGMIGGNIAFTILLGLINHEDPEIQHAAAEAVAQIQANQASQE
ncbi:MAG: HEAT repeat domain-containing protein [Desulfovibrionaceae bacterium]|nr:HEAT repeat domain-containing protein [Desulfovibrionaceae bacterium]